VYEKRSDSPEGGRGHHSPCREAAGLQVGLQRVSPLPFVITLAATFGPPWRS